MTKKEKVLKLIQITSQDKNVIDYFNRLMIAIENDLGKEESKDIKDFFANELIPTIKEDTATLMEENLGEETIDQIIAFYESDLGQKITAWGNKYTELLNVSCEEKWTKMVHNKLTEVCGFSL
jgi:hypothetical protein